MATDFGISQDLDKMYERLDAKDAKIKLLKLERDGQESILQSANNDIRRMQITLNAKDAEIERLKAELSSYDDISVKEAREQADEQRKRIDALLADQERRIIKAIMALPDIDCFWHGYEKGLIERKATLAVIKKACEEK